MNAFVPVARDARHDQFFRENLLAQPPEYFRVYCGGGIPNPVQRLQIIEELVQSLGSSWMYANETYRVQVRTVPPFVHLDITRCDGRPCTNWRDFQQIKNELVGPEFEGVELFPAESRLVDTANQYHMWVRPQTGYRFPFGYQNRLVLKEPLFFRGAKRVLAPSEEGQPRAPLEMRTIATLGR
jgi:hypothetical protein